MYAPHTVTICNVVLETDPATMQETETLYTTVLRGSMLQAGAAAKASAPGLKSDDCAVLFIPFSVHAVDGATGKAKQYAAPEAFAAAADKTGLWTLSTHDSATLFVKGEASPASAADARKLPGCYTLTGVDIRDYGSAAMQHWECRGA